MTPSVRNLRYVRLGTPDVEAAARFLTRIVGLQEVGRMGAPGAGLAAYFRCDQRHHGIVYFESGQPEQALGLEFAGDPAQFKATARAWAGRGIVVRLGTRDECAVRNVAAMAVMRDPSGNVLEIVVPARDSDGAFVPTRMAGVAGLAHVGLRSSDPARDEAFWVEILGARVSDRIGQAPLLRLDQDHYRIALLPARQPGIQHVALQVGTFDDVMRAWYFLRENGVRILFGPGREPTSTSTFVYFEGPDGLAFEYATPPRRIPGDVTHHPRHFPVAARSHCMWGGKPDMPEFNPPPPGG